MIFVASPAQLIALLAFQALLGSMATPAWTALIGDLVPAGRLGRANASISKWASVGGLAATLVSGASMITIGGTLQGMFFVPLAVACVFGLASSLIVLYVKEPRSSALQDSGDEVRSGFVDLLKRAWRTRSFAEYCGVAATYEFFMSMSWPLFSITQVKIMNASMLQIALLSVAQTVVLIAFQGWAGRLADTVGRKPLIVFFRFTLVTVPLAYALTGDIDVLIVVSMFWGLSFALGQPAVTAYLLDVTPQEHRGSFVALYNLVIGVVTFCGSLIGGYVADYTIALHGLVVGLQIVYAVSVGGRIVGAILHLTLSETLNQDKPR
jgi:MFS family permease